MQKRHGLAVAYLGSFVLGIQEFGLVMAGVGFGIAYPIYYIVVAIAAYKLIGSKPTQRNWSFTLLLLLTGGIIMSLAAQSAPAGYAIGPLATLLVSVYRLRRLGHLIDLTGWLPQKFL